MAITTGSMRRRTSRPSMQTPQEAQSSPTELETQTTIPSPGHSDNNNLSRAAKVTAILILLSFLVASSYVAHPAVYLLPITLAPTATLLYYRTTLPPTRSGHLETLVWTYLFTATLSTIALLVVQGMLSYALTSALFNASDLDFFNTEFARSLEELRNLTDAQRSARAYFAARPQYWIFVVLMTFGIAGLTEETQKYFSIRLATRYGGRKHPTAWDLIAYGAVAGMAFATLEMVMFLVAAQDATLAQLCLMVLERLVIGFSVHPLCGVLIASGMAKQYGRTSSIWRVLWRPVLCHGAIDFGLFAISALRGNVGWVHPDDVAGTMGCYLVAGGIIACLVMLVRRDIEEFVIGGEDGVASLRTPLI